MNPWPYYDTDEIAAGQQVLASGRVNYWNGEEGRDFEREFAAAMDCGHAVALANGTVPPDLALHVLGIGAGDKVVVTPRPFIVSASCCQPRPILSGLEPRSDSGRAAGSRYYRLRVADWRVVYDIRDDELVIIVLTVQPRGGAYR